MILHSVLTFICNNLGQISPILPCGEISLKTGPTGWWFRAQGAGRVGSGRHGSLGHPLGGPWVCRYEAHEGWDRLFHSRLNKVLRQDHWSGKDLTNRRDRGDEDREWEHMLKEKLVLWFGDIWGHDVGASCSPQGDR